MAQMMLLTPMLARSWATDDSTFSSQAGTVQLSARVFAVTRSPGFRASEGRRKTGRLLHNKLRKNLAANMSCFVSGGPLFSTSCSGTQPAVLHEPLNMGGEVNVRRSFFI